MIEIEFHGQAGAVYEWLTQNFGPEMVTWRYHYSGIFSFSDKNQAAAALLKWSGAIL